MCRGDGPPWSEFRIPTIFALDGAVTSEDAARLVVALELCTFVMRSGEYRGNARFPGLWGDEACMARGRVGAARRVELKPRCAGGTTNWFCEKPRKSPSFTLTKNDTSKMQLYGKPSLWGHPISKTSA